MLHTHAPRERDPRFGARAPTGTARCSRALMMVMLPLAALLAGCLDERSPTAPAQDEESLTVSAVGVADVTADVTAGDVQTGPVTAAIALEDALARVLPALEAGGPTAVLDAGLRQLRTQLEEGGAGSDGLALALSQVEKAVEKYQAAAAEEFRPDISVVKLALDAVAHG